MSHKTPGVYRVDGFPPPAAELRTGVPAFLGYTSIQPQEVVRLALWTQFAEQLGAPTARSFLAEAVRGFFENGGTLCYVVPLEDDLPPLDALQKGLEMLAPLVDFDLICAPDIMRPEEDGSLLENDVQQMQIGLLQSCDERGDCFAILDCLPNLDIRQMVQQRQQLTGRSGALYYPWIKTQSASTSSAGFVPPCGHIAGVYARSDERIGVHKAPANEILEGVLDLERNLSDVEQGELNPQNVNCLRAFPGRGIRVWGARTLDNDPAGMYINVRRLLLTVGRWIESNMAGMVFEQNNPLLWQRIERELTFYFDGLWRRGALRGSKAEEAYSVKCNEETNPAEIREEGKVITQIGLSPATLNEFIVIRIIHGLGGVSMIGPDVPG
jgi:Bacteriophage tail sheath protein